MSRLWVLAVAFWSGCASFGTFMGQEGGEVTYASTVEENMQRGDDAMSSRNFNEAATYFEYVKTKYPYSELSKTAELRLADADFERERFLEARDRYQNFVRLHPTHPKVDYAAFRAAFTHYKEIPSDFFLLPPSSEKDQVEVRNALTSMSDFVRLYTGSEHLPQARKIIDEVKLKMAEHELAIADFYANPNRSKWRAVISRLSVVEKSFSGIGLDESVAFRLMEAHLKLNEPWKARAALERYAAKFPQTPGAQKALARAATLPATAPPLPESSPDAGS